MFSIIMRHMVHIFEKKEAQGLQEHKNLHEEAPTSNKNKLDVVNDNKTDHEFKQARISVPGLAICFHICKKSGNLRQLLCTQFVY